MRPDRFAWPLLVLLSACQSAPSDVRTWQPSDHHNTGAGQATNDAKRPRQSTGEETDHLPGLDEVSIATWRAQCMTCHGSIGRGDGPQAAMFKPRDLSDTEWQNSVTDEQLYESIQKGKNKMPGFALPETVARNLVSLVRLFDPERRRKQAEAAATGSGSVQPASGSATTNPSAGGPAPTTAASAGPASTRPTVADPAVTGGGSTGGNATRGAGAHGTGAAAPGR